MEMNLWNTFDAVRPKLERQYLEPEFASDTGEPPEELKRMAEALVREHSGEPRIRLRAMLLELLLTRGRIGVDPADWFADHLDADGVMVPIREHWRDEARRAMPEVAARCAANSEQGLSLSQLDLSHTSPDWRNVLKLGPAGIRDRAEKALETAEDGEAREFFAAVARVYGAMCRYIVRLADEADRRGAVRVTGALRAIAERPPETLQQALQLALLYHHTQELEGELVRSMGCFDRLFIGFYRRDLAAGRLNREQAKELLKFYWTKFFAQTQGKLWGKNFCFGGMDGDGSDACNELTELGFEVYRELRTVDPKLSLRVHGGLPEKVLLQAAECVCSGRTAVVFANDEIAKEMFVRRGKLPEEIADFIPVGCYEPCVMGKELCCSMSTLFNLAKAVELLMENPAPPRDFGELLGRYLGVVREKLDDALELTRRWELRWPEINPSPLLSGTMDSCFEKGRDVSAAGTKYSSSGVMCAGLGSAADSLTALRILLFEERRCTWEELRATLKADWEGREPLRLYVSGRLPKWGNNLPEPDALARKIADAVAERINRAPNARGGFFQTGMWSIDWAQRYGGMTGATPDGRRAGEPLSKNLGAAIAKDRRGVAALLHSAVKLDQAEFPDGAVLDVMLHPSMVKGKEGPKVVADLVRTYFEAGGLFIQFNILDVDTLRRARREPEKYSSVQIRVCGWNVRFIDLDPAAQELFIQEAESKSC